MKVYLIVLLGNKHHTKGAVTSVITLQKTKCMVSDDEEDEEVSATQ